MYSLCNTAGPLWGVYDNYTLPKLPQRTDKSARMKMPMPVANDPEQLSLFEAGPDVSKLRSSVRRLTAATRAENTITAYESDWRSFAEWCQSAGRRQLPARTETVALYIAEALETHKVSTVQRRVAAIRAKHLAEGHQSPTDHPDVTDVMRGARRTFGTSAEAKAAITASELLRMLATQPKTNIGARNRALLLLGFASGMRRSELVNLNVADIDFTTKGMRVRIGKSKTDQDGAGRIIGIFPGSQTKSCPVAAVKNWIAQRGKGHGPLFTNLSANAPDNTHQRLSTMTVWRIVKDAAEAIGLDPTLYGAHSLRAGCVTAAIEAGTSESAVMQRTGHKSIQTVSKYFRPANLWKNDPLAKVL